MRPTGFFGDQIVVHQRGSCPRLRFKTLFSATSALPVLGRDGNLLGQQFEQRMLQDWACDVLLIRDAQDRDLWR